MKLKELDLLVNATVNDFITEVILKKDLTAPTVLKPWELLHHENIGKALYLSRTTHVSVIEHLQFTKEKQEIILRGAIEGLFPKESAKIAKILPETLKRWFALGEKHISPYYEFLLEYNQAEALAVAADNRTLSNTGYRGASFRLERRWKKSYGEAPAQQTAVQINNEVTHAPIASLKGEARAAAIANLLASDDIEEAVIIDS